MSNEKDDKSKVGNRQCQPLFYDMLRCVEAQGDATKCKVETNKFLECENHHFQRSIKTAVYYERQRARAREERRMEKDENVEVTTIEIAIPTPVNPLKYYKGLGEDLLAAGEPRRIYEQIGRIFGDLRVSGDATVRIIRRFFQNDE